VRARDVSVPTLQSHQATVAEQIRPDLALLEWRQMDASRQQPGQVGLAHVERQLAKILDIAHQHIDRVELHFVIVPARMQSVESERPSAPKITDPPSMTKELFRLRNAASDERRPTASVVDAAREQAHALAVALND
jgi:hypothetical protein